MPSVRPALIALALLIPLWPAHAGSGPRWTPPSAIDGAELKALEPAQVEDQALRGDPSQWRKIRTRDGMWVILAQDRGTWDREVAPALGQVLGPDGGAEPLARWLASPPPGVEVRGPALSGASVRIDLPDERGDVVFAIDLPLVLKDGSDPAGTNRKRPNQGLFLSAAELAPSSTSAFRAMHVPSRPLALVHGAPPAVQPRPLPGNGKGEFVLLAGRGAAGEEVAELRREAKKLLGGGPLPAGAMRAFPEEGGIQGNLKSYRVRTSQPRHRQDPWSTLASEPKDWDWQDARVRHPTGVWAGVAPVTLDPPSSGQVVVGIVATWTRLFVDPDEAALLAGVDGKVMWRATQDGELPVFRIGGDVLIHRAHLDRWTRGEAKGRSGEGKGRGEASRQVQGWAEKAGSAGADRAASLPLPARLEPIPAQELGEVVGKGRTHRGRHFRDDLGEWIRHWDKALDKGGHPTVHVLSARGEWAQLTGRFRTEAEALVAHGGPETGVTPAEDDTVDLDALPAATSPASAGASRGTTAPVATVGAARRIADLTVEPTGPCTPGQRVDVGVAFSLLGAPEGSRAMLRLEWDLLVGKASVRRDAMTFSREAGDQEVEFALACPEKAADGTLHVVVAWSDANVKGSASAPLPTRAQAGRGWRTLAMPSPQKCVDQGPPGEDDGGFSVDVGGGLTAESISRAVRAFQEETLRCQPEGRPVSGSIVLEVTVGCDGRVSSVAVATDGTADTTFSACVADTFRYCPFPAHGNSGGVVFQQPLHYE